MKKLLMIAGAALIASSAFAQTTTKLSGLNLRLGVFYPTDTDTRDFTNDLWFGGGVDFKLRDLDFGSGSMVKYSLGISADWLQSNDVRTIPVLLTLTGTQGQGIYWLAGAGVGFNHFPGTDETKFAYMVGLGYEFRSGMNPISFEVRYNGNSRKEVAGIGAYVGFKF